MVEKRKFPRIEGIVPLKLCGSESDMVTQTRNLSANGAYCAVDKNIDPMTKLDIVLLIPVKKQGHKSVRKITCKGIVVRSDHVQDNGDRSYCLGIYFNEIKDSDRKVLVSYINSTIKLPENIPNVF